MQLFLSYSSKDRQYANEIDSYCMRNGLYIIRDDRDLKPLDDIINFMNNVKKSDYIIILVSENYLGSKNCLFEFNEFQKRPNFQKNIIPVLLPSFAISDKNHALLIKSFTSSKTILEKFFTLFSDIDEKSVGPLLMLTNIWSYISNTKLFDYEKLKSIEFKAIFDLTGLSQNRIWKDIIKIKKIKDNQDQEIAFNELLKQHPGSYIILLHQGIINEEKGNYKNAIYYFQEFLKKFADHPEVEFAYYSLGLCYFAMEHYDKAIECHTKAIDFSPKGSFWKSYNGLGDVYYMLNQFDKAVDCYKQANSIVKEYKTCYQLGLIEHNRGNYTLAIKYFKEAIKIDGIQYAAYLNLIGSYDQVGLEKEKNEFIRKAYKLFPDDYRIMTRYGILILADDFSSAIKILLKSLDINPDYIPTRIPLIKLRLGSSATSEEKQKAVKFLEETLQLALDSKDEAEIYYCVTTLASAYTKLNNTRGLAYLKLKYVKYFSEGWELNN